MFDTDKRLASVRPSRRQLEFQKTEFYAFAEKVFDLSEVKGLLTEAVNEHNRAEQEERC